MAISAVNLAGLSGLVHDFGPQLCETAQKSASPLLADDSVVEKPDPKGGEYVFSVMPAENHASSIVPDGGALPQGGADLPVKGRVFPANHVGIVEMGRAAAETNIDDELSELFETTIKNRSSQMARQIGRALYGTVAVNPAATTWSATDGTAVATVTFADLSLFRPGMAVDFVDLTGPNKVFTVRCTGTSYTSGVGGTASFINDIINPATLAITALTDTTIAIGDRFVLRGALGPGYGATATATSTAFGYNDCIGTGSLHGITNAALPGWEGPTRAAGGSLSQELLLGFAAQAAQFSGMAHTHVLMSPNLAAAFMAATNNTGTTVGGFAAQPVPGMDKYKASAASGVTVGGKPLVIDPNCPAAQVVFHNRDYAVCPMWKKLGPDTQDGEKLLSRTNYSYSYQIDARLNMAFKKRSTISIVTGITAFA